MNNQINQFNPSAMTTSSNLNQGAVAIEQSRAITEAQGKLVLSKQFPRDENDVFQKLMVSCQRYGLANIACYSYPRGGQSVTGPSIRLAEEIARLYGNLEYGIRELSSANGESEMEAYAWDLQTNVLSTQKFKVKHERSKRGGATKLTDSRDIYEITANMGARRLRSRLLSILPPDLVECAVLECRKTLSGNNQVPIQDRVRSMIDQFKKLGVNKDKIEKYIDCSFDDITEDQVLDLGGIFNSIKNGQSGKDDWFKVEKQAATKGFNPAATVENKPVPKTEKTPEPELTNEQIADKF